jgi:hypothetical protein
MTDFELSAGEKSHPLWARLKAHFEERLAAARVRNDGGLDELNTAVLRGEIKVLKHLIALDADKPVVETTIL